MTYTIRNHHSPNAPAVHNDDGTPATFNCPTAALEALGADLTENDCFSPGDWYRCVGSDGRIAWTLVMAA